MKLTKLKTNLTILINLSFNSLKGRVINHMRFPESVIWLKKVHPKD
ncbi:hypothetical protein HMPREF0496_2591 [Lentilactobacillus hilgardii ATCC 27305]|nr:hypothetical protein HMPREF0496_2591 [Lentilactobacillus hilgardii ATCC 27305]